MSYDPLKKMRKKGDSIQPTHRTFEESEMKWELPDPTGGRKRDLSRFEVERPRFGGDVIEAQVVEKKPTMSYTKPVVDFYEETKKISNWTKMSESGEGLLVKLDAGIRLKREFGKKAKDERLSHVDRDKFKELSIGIERNLESLREEAYGM